MSPVAACVRRLQHANSGLSLAQLLRAFMHRLNIRCVECGDVIADKRDMFNPENEVGSYVLREPVEHR